MKEYYVIFETARVVTVSARVGTVSTRPLWATTDKALVDNFCKEFPNFYYKTYEYQDTASSTTAGSAVDDNVYKPKGLYSDIRCPYCGSAHFSIDGGYTTAVYYPQIVKDGVLQSTGHNSTTEEFTCCDCGKRFSRKDGKVQQVD